MKYITPSDGAIARPAAPLSFTPGGDDLDGAEAASATYHALTGHEPADAWIDDDESFDAHVFASVLALAASEPGNAGEHVGLSGDDLAALIERWFPQVFRVAVLWRPQDGNAEDEEMVMVRDLLLAHRSTEGDDSRWLAAMIARRSMEPNHLWEDLGLRDRSELSRLLTRHFAPLATRNTQNMRWKRFFYRMLCEDDGLVMCSTPVCSRCGDFNVCFGDESGESRMAHRRRVLALKVASLPDAGEIVPAPSPL